MSYNPVHSAPWLKVEAIRLSYARCQACDDTPVYSTAYGSKEWLCKKCWHWADSLGWCSRY